MMVFLEQPSEVKVSTSSNIVCVCLACVDAVTCGLCCPSAWHAMGNGTSKCSVKIPKRAVIISTNESIHTANTILQVGIYTKVIYYNDICIKIRTFKAVPSDMNHPSGLACVDDAFSLACGLGGAAAWRMLGQMLR